MDFKKRVNDSWTDTPHYIMGTSTDTITTLPADIYPTGTTATVGLKGQMEQNGTPTPTTPIQPQETGDLETVGGQYKIPISSADTTTNIYLGEVETTRKIKKLVLTGEEAWVKSGAASNTFYTNVSGYLRRRGVVITICSHYISRANINAGAEIQDGNVSFYANLSRPSEYFYIRDSHLATVADLKTFLAQQYAAGTPVTIWYVLAEPTTGIVNEPLRKIGDYADTVSGITIPTIAGANTIDVDTMLKPSEVSVNYKGWHSIQSLHRFNGSSWD